MAGGAAGGSSSAMEEIKKGVVGRLDKCGALGQLRAQVRASMYKALLDPNGTGVECPADVAREAPLPLLSIVADFLKMAELENTADTLLREANCKIVKDRQELATSLKCVQPAAPDCILARVVETVRRKGPSSRSSAPSERRDDSSAQMAGTASKPRVVTRDGASAAAPRARSTSPGGHVADMSASSLGEEHRAPGAESSPNKDQVGSEEPEVARSSGGQAHSSSRTLITDESEEVEGLKRNKWAGIHSPSPSNSAEISEGGDMSVGGISEDD